MPMMNNMQPMANGAQMQPTNGMNQPNGVQPMTGDGQQV